MFLIRFVSIDNAQEGMVLGRPLRGRNGEILLAAGITLRPSFIESIKRLRYSGIYIQDAFSEDIQVEDIISEELRVNASSAVKRIEAGILSGMTRGVGKDLDMVADFIDNIIDSVLSSRETVVNLVDLKIFDLYTYQHSVSVCVLSEVLGAAMRLERTQLFNLGMTAILHDIGKFFIDKEILNKPGRLSTEEFETVKKHSELGCEYLRANFNYSSGVNVGILQHHERFNGTGYPHGRGGTDIHPFARIIAVADVYDALTSLRPYHQPVLPSEAHEYVMGNAGAHFDPDIVEVFVRKIAPFPEGMEVELSNGLRGIVCENDPDFMTRPKIKLLPVAGAKAPLVEFVNLKDDPAMLNVTISRVV